VAIKQREPAQSDYVIELEDVSLSYDYGTPWQVDAVKPLSLRIAKGEWIANLWQGSFWKTLELPKGFIHRCEATHWFFISVS